MRQIWDWDSSTFLGVIPEANQTYNVVGNANEHGLAIGETTFGGLGILDGNGGVGIIDYGSLIWLTLQRAKTAREAIATMGSLVTEFGYASDGESFAIADGNEAWLMEMVGKGKEETGAVWVAMRVPDGYITATANQARIRTFPLDDPDAAMYAPDVVSFAQRKGLYPQDAPAAEFSFSDTYDPISFVGARLAEIRVWALFQQATGGAFDAYTDYVSGANYSNRMPLFAKPRSKLTVNDTMTLMRTHFEGTVFDNRGLARADAAAGAGHSPYRWRPLVWQVDGNSYVNERTVGVQQSAWAFVAQSRAALPAPLRAILWFAPDDSATAVRVPLYGGITRIPRTFADRAGQDPASAVPYAVEADANKMSLDSAFWVWNLVANMAYGDRYSDVYPLIQAEIQIFQAKLLHAAQATDAAAAELYSSDPAAAVELITNFSCTTADQMTADWLAFWMRLFVRFRDGFTVSAPVLPQCDLEKGQKENCTARVVPMVQEAGYTADWYRRILADPGNAQHYAKLPDPNDTDSARKLLRIQKRRA